MLNTILKLIGRYVSPAEESARALFRATNPAFSIAWSTLKEEQDRYVVGIFFGSTRPPHYKFYVVSKNGLIATLLADDSDYAPRNWR
jgi:hypothetical protein